MREAQLNDARFEETKAHAAREAHLQLDQVTIENLSAIGVKGEA